MLENDLYNLYNKSSIKDNYNEYQKIISEKPDITDEDYLYIQEIIGNSMNKELIVERDDNKQLFFRSFKRRIAFKQWGTEFFIPNF